MPGSRRACREHYPGGTSIGRDQPLFQALLACLQCLFGDMSFGRVYAFDKDARNGAVILNNWLIDKIDIDLRWGCIAESLHQERHVNYANVTVTNLLLFYGRHKKNICAIERQTAVIPRTTCHVPTLVSMSMPASEVR